MDIPLPEESEPPGLLEEQMSRPPPAVFPHCDNIPLPTCEVKFDPTVPPPIPINAFPIGPPPVLPPNLPCIQQISNVIVVEDPMDDPNRYSPSRATAEDDIPITPPPLPSQSEEPSRSNIVGSKPTVLGKEQAKKRLLAFSMTKQGGGAGLSFGFQKKMTPKVNTGSAKAFSGATVEEDGTIQEGKETVIIKPEKPVAQVKKKSSKKGSREDKARAVISAIEEIKREELMLRGALPFGVKDVKIGDITAPIPLLAHPFGLISLKPKEFDFTSNPALEKQKGTIVSLLDNLLTKNEKLNSEADAPKTVKNEEKKKEERKKDSDRGDGSRHRSEKHKNKERHSRSGKDRHKDEKRPRTHSELPTSWTHFHSEGYRIEEIRRLKLKIEDNYPGNSASNSRSRDRHRRRSRDRRSRSWEDKRHRKSPVNDPSKETKIEEDLTHVYRPFQGASQLRYPLMIQNSAQSIIEYPRESVRYTKTRPHITYCERPDSISAHYRTRNEVFRDATAEMVKLMKIIINSRPKDNLVQFRCEAGENLSSSLAALQVSYDEPEVDGSPASADNIIESKREDRAWFPVKDYLISNEIQEKEENPIAEVDMSVKDEKEDVEMEKEIVIERKISESMDIDENELTSPSSDHVREATPHIQSPDVSVKAERTTVRSKWDSDYEEDMISTEEIQEVSSKEQNIEATEKHSKPEFVNDEIKDKEDYEMNVENQQNEETPLDKKEEEKGEDIDENHQTNELDLNRNNEDEESEILHDSSHTEDLNRSNVTESSNADQKLVSEYEEFMKAVSFESVLPKDKLCEEQESAESEAESDKESEKELPEENIYERQHLELPMNDTWDEDSKEREERVNSELRMLEKVIRENSTKKKKKKKDIRSRSSSSSDDENSRNKKHEKKHRNSKDETKAKKESRRKSVTSDGSSSSEESSSSSSEDEHEKRKHVSKKDKGKKKLEIPNISQITELVEKKPKYKKSSKKKKKKTSRKKKQQRKRSKKRKVESSSSSDDSSDSEDSSSSNSERERKVSKNKDTKAQKKEDSSSEEDTSSSTESTSSSSSSSPHRKSSKKKKKKKRSTKKTKKDAHKKKKEKSRKRKKKRHNSPGSDTGKSSKNKRNRKRDGNSKLNNGDDTVDLAELEAQLIRRGHNSDTSIHERHFENISNIASDFKEDTLSLQRGKVPFLSPDDDVQEESQKKSMFANNEHHSSDGSSWEDNHQAKIKQNNDPEVSQNRIINKLSLEIDDDRDEDTEKRKLPKKRRRDERSNSASPLNNFGSKRKRSPSSSPEHSTISRRSSTEGKKFRREYNASGGETSEDHHLRHEEGRKVGHNQDEIEIDETRRVSFTAEDEEAEYDNESSSQRLHRKVRGDCYTYSKNFSSGLEKNNTNFDRNSLLLKEEKQEGITDDNDDFIVTKDISRDIIDDQQIQNKENNAQEEDHEDSESVYSPGDPLENKLDSDIFSENLQDILDSSSQHSVIGSCHSNLSLESARSPTESIDAVQDFDSPSALENLKVIDQWEGCDSQSRQSEVSRSEPIHTQIIPLASLEEDNFIQEAELSSQGNNKNNNESQLSESTSEQHLSTMKILSAVGDFEDAGEEKTEEGKEITSRNSGIENSGISQQTDETNSVNKEKNKQVIESIYPEESDASEDVNKNTDSEAKVQIKHPWKSISFSLKGEGSGLSLYDDILETGLTEHHVSSTTVKSVPEISKEEKNQSGEAIAKERIRKRPSRWGMMTTPVKKSSMEDLQQDDAITSQHYSGTRDENVNLDNKSCEMSSRDAAQLHGRRESKDSDTHRVALGEHSIDEDNGNYLYESESVNREEEEEKDKSRRADRDPNEEEEMESRHFKEEEEYKEYIESKMESYESHMPPGVSSRESRTVIKMEMDSRWNVDSIEKLNSNMEVQWETRVVQYVSRSRSKSPDFKGWEELSPHRISRDKYEGQTGSSMERHSSLDDERIRSDRLRENNDRMREGMTDKDRLRESSKDRLRERDMDRIRENDSIRDRDRIRTNSREREGMRESNRDRIMESSRDRDRMRESSRDRGRTRGSSRDRLRDRDRDRVRSRDHDRFRERHESSRERRPRDRWGDDIERSRERDRERRGDRRWEKDRRDRKRDERSRDHDRERGHWSERNRSPVIEDRREQDSSAPGYFIPDIPLPRTSTTDTWVPSNTAGSGEADMELSCSPASSPLVGFKRSLADSTISDSELVAAAATAGKHDEPHSSPSLQRPTGYYNADPYVQIPYRVAKEECATSPPLSPAFSPKRLSLDDRIKLELGVKKSPPPLPSVPQQIPVYHQHQSYQTSYPNYYPLPPQTTFEGEKTMPIPPHYVHPQEEFSDPSQHKLFMGQPPLPPEEKYGPTSKRRPVLPASVNIAPGMSHWDSPEAFIGTQEIHKAGVPESFIQLGHQMIAPPESFQGTQQIGGNSHVVQVGNMIQVVPTDLPAGNVLGSLPPPPPPAQPSHKSMVLQSGNVLQVIPSENYSVASGNTGGTTQVYQVGNVLQVVPAPNTASNSTQQAKPPQEVSAVVAPVSKVPVSQRNLLHGLPGPPLPLPLPVSPSLASGSRASLPLPPAAVAFSPPASPFLATQQQSMLLPGDEEIIDPQLAVLSPSEAPKDEVEKRREERERRRQEKERRRREKEKRRQAKMKLAADNIIKRALQQESEGDIDIEEMRLIEEAMQEVPEEEPITDMSEVTPPKKKRRSAVQVMPLPPAGKGILISPGFRERASSTETKESKTVKFADGVRPGEGTSPSAGEDLPSPPPPPRKLPKEKRFKKKKKKKIKVKIIRQINVEEDDDDDDDISPPPPPPGSPPPPPMYPAGYPAGYPPAGFVYQQPQSYTVLSSTEGTASAAGGSTTVFTPLYHQHHHTTTTTHTTTVQFAPPPPPPVNPAPPPPPSPHMYPPQPTGKQRKTK